MTVSPSLANMMFSGKPFVVGPLQPPISPVDVSRRPDSPPGANGTESPA